MATILKWWKMKMLGGYKHMPGLISESDCDPVVPEGSQRSSLCCRGHRCPSSTDETRLCESDDDAEDAYSGASEDLGQAEEVTRSPTPPTPATPEAAPPKDEFNFTLYDFDGHGKVTKDDIAGLVRAIYDVVGSSVRVPPSGSKTIHVKLTVTPEQPAADAGGGPPEQQQRDLSITIRSSGGRVEAETPRRARSQSVRGAAPAGWRARSPGAEGAPPRQGRQAAADSARRRQLVEALQLGMQNNNLKLSNLKRHHSDCDHLRRRPHPRPPPEAHCCPRDAGDGADAAGCGQCVRERWTRRHAACRARRCQPPLQQQPQQQQQQQQQRCYQEDDYELLARCAEFALREAQEKREPAGRGRPGRPRPAPPPGASPHHHMKHKNRERDHYRAMQQVLSWLEREHAAPAPAETEAVGCGRGRSCGPVPGSPQRGQTPPQPPPPQPQPQPQPQQPPPQPQPTTAVEHHHMHEHVHHHFHHFTKGAVIL